MNQREYLLPIVRRYFEDDPVTAAHNLEDLSTEECVDLLRVLSPKLAAKLLLRLSTERTASIVSESQPEDLVHIFVHAGGDFCSSVLLNLSSEKRERFILALPRKLRDQVQELLTFPAGTAGSVMRTDYTVFNVRTTVKDAAEGIKRYATRNIAPSNVFVVDDENHLKGVVSMRTLVTAPRSSSLGDLMFRDPVSVNAFSDQEEAFRELAARGFTSIPVVDSQNRLLGIVRAANLLEGARELATADIQKLFGAGKDERAFSSLTFSLRKRLPWLHVNLLTAFMAAAVVALFESTIAKMTFLAVYLPVVAGQGGNAGAQSLAVVMRGLVMREIPTQDVKRLLIKETSLGAINGIAIGVVTGLIAWWWQGNPYLGVVIALAMLVNLTAAGLAGAAIPLLMRRFGLDPAQCSSIVLTTITDIVGFFAFLGFASMFQSVLL